MPDDQVEHISFSVRVPLWLIAVGVGAFVAIAALLIFLGAVVA